MSSYDDELQKCLRYCQGGDGELAYNAGYSIYNINGVLTSTWEYDRASLCEADALINDQGTEGVSVFHLLHPMRMRSITTGNIWMFDAATTTNGGSGTPDVKTLSVIDASGTLTHNVVITANPKFNSIKARQTTLVGDGVTRGFFLIEREIF